MREPSADWLRALASCLRAVTAVSAVAVRVWTLRLNKISPFGCGLLVLVVQVRRLTETP
jgi:hypothetical protein